LTKPLLVPRPLVAVDEGELVKLEARELAELITEEREERDEERDEGTEREPLELIDEDPDTDEVTDDDDDDEDNEPPKVEVGGEVDVTEGITGMEVGLFKQTSELPGPTVIAGVALPTPLASLSTITTLVPEAIVT